jgi:hypothetical protein
MVNGRHFRTVTDEHRQQLPRGVVVAHAQRNNLGEALVGRKPAAQVMFHLAQLDALPMQLDLGVLAGLSTNDAAVRSSFMLTRTRCGPWISSSPMELTGGSQCWPGGRRRANHARSIGRQPRPAHLASTLRGTASLLSASVRSTGSAAGSGMSVAVLRPARMGSRR